MLVGRDDISRLYFFPKSNVKNRIQVTDFIPSTEDNTLKSDAEDLIILDFTDEDYSNYLISGWGKIEAGLGTWGMDGRSVLFISFSDSKENVLKLTAKPLPNPELIQKMDIILNNSRVSEIELTNINDFSEYTVKLKSEFIKEGVNILEFKYGYSFTPLELGISNDSRRLAVMFKKIEIGNLDK